MRTVLSSLMLGTTLIMPVSASAACRFVAVDDPKFTISLEGDGGPLVTYDGRSERYEARGTGTGQTAMLAIPPNGDETLARGFALHRYEGRSFLVWGVDLLVETCD